MVFANDGVGSKIIPGGIYNFSGGEACVNSIVYSNLFVTRSRCFFILNTKET